MKRFLPLILLVILSTELFSQNMSYTCPRDTILGCNSSCLTITGKIPDIRSSTSTYRMGNISDVVQPCIPNPNIVGTDAFITAIDDTYSSLISIGFNFPFYGANYSNVVAGTNGYLTFDASLAGGYCMWSLSAGNVPNASYDGAIIMGPWHDIDPDYTTSPTRTIKYSVTGAAPNRRWTLNFFKIPLFSSTCQNQIENTHRIVLHESTGLIEIIIFDKEQCPTWNTGRGMVGIQDLTKTQAMMAPGRAATDAPWGSIGMNEVWRFVPASGPPLYRSTQLLDATGTVVATGDTTRIDEGNFSVSFPNVCPPLSATNSLYVIKTVYQKIDDPNATIYSLDTIHVIRQAQLPVTATMTSTTCGASTGTITVSAAGTPPYQYTLDGGTAQSNPLFTGVSVGPHTVSATDATGCNNTYTITVTAVSSLPSNTTSSNCTCPGRNDGTITVTPTLGIAPFTFTITGTATVPGPITNNTAATFNNLEAGTYTVTFTDANNCAGTTASIVITAGTAITSTYSTTNSCPGLNNGGSTITATSGTGPYTFTLTGYTGTPIAVPPASMTFPSLAGSAFGTSYAVTISDATGCTGTKTMYVYEGAGITGVGTFTDATCAAVANGTLTVTPNSGTGPYTFSIDGGPFVPSSTPPAITFTGLAQGSHTVTIKDVSGCTGTVTKTIGAGAGLTATATATAASCSMVSNGTILVTTTNGTAPLTYTLDAGAYQAAANATATFINVSSGSHTVGVRDNLGCTGTATITVTAGPGLTGSFTSTPTSCPGATNGTLTITVNNGVSPYNYSIDGGTAQSGASPRTLNNVASGAHLVTITDNLGCTGTVGSIVAAGPGLIGSFTSTPTSCPGATNGTVTITAINGAAPYTFSIDGSAPITGTNPYTFNNISSGSHVAIFADNSGCQGTVPATVAAGPGLIGSFTSTATSCPGATNGTITITATNGAGPYTFSLDGSTSVSGTNPYTFNNVSSGSHVATFTDNSGCIGTVPATVADGPALVVTNTNVNPPCNNISDGTITLVPSVTDSYTYTLTLTGQSTITQTSPLFTGLAIGNYSYTIASTTSGCQGSGTTTLTTNPAITTTVSLTMPLCKGGSDGIITLVPSGGVPSYEYSIDGGVTYQTSNSFNTVAAGTHTIRIRDNVGCTKDTTVTLAEPTLLTASATSTPGGCNGNDGTIVVTAADGTPGYSYSIDNGSTYQSAPNFIVSGGNYPNIKVKDANGCVTNTSVVVTLIDDMTIIPMRDTTICAESSVQLFPQVSNQASVFNWSTLTTPALTNTLSDSTIRNPVATPTDTIIYTLQAYWGVCHREDTIKVNVLHKPIPYAGPDVTVCHENSDTILVGSVRDTSGTVNYSWSPANSCSTPNDHITTVSPTSTQLYTLTVTDNYGCNYSVTDEVLVTLQPPVPAFAGRDTIAQINYPLQLNASGGDSYEWSPANLNIISNPAISNPFITIQNDQLFTLIVTAGGHCLGYDTVFVRAYRDSGYYVPTSFTPNGDGLNDFFRAIPVKVASTDYFRIFNRYGQLIFQTNKWLKGWDGTYQGKKQPIGTYVWSVKGRYQNGEIVEKSGTVLLLQ
jgi:gliding motility-associated-like protein